MDTRPFDHARQIADRTISLLQSYEIKVEPGSALEAALFEMLDIEAKRAGRSPFDVDTDMRRIWSHGMGILLICEMLVELDVKGRQLHSIIPHLRLLNKGAAAQNVRQIGDEATNKLFELLLALGCKRVATEIELDDPDESKGDNPDVMCRFEGTKWTLAAKTPNGESMISAFENIESGVDQIMRSDAARGVVVLNARNWVDHDKVWLPPRNDQSGSGVMHLAWPDEDSPRQVLYDEADRRFRELVAAKDGELIDLFKSAPKVAPHVLVYLASATVITRLEKPTMTRFGVFRQWSFGDSRPTDLCFSKALNWGVNFLPEIPDLEPPPPGAPA